VKLALDCFKDLFVICAHPDDECLMAGSLIESFLEKEKDVKILFYSHETQQIEPGGTNVQKNGIANISIQELNNKTNNIVGDFKGICSSDSVKYYSLSLPDQKFQFFDYGKMSEQVSIFLSKAESNSLVVTHHSNDINNDHEVVAKSTAVALRKHLFAGTALEGYIHGSTKMANFNPNVFFNSEQYLEAKIKRFRKYRNQQRDSYHPRSIYALKSIESFFGTYFGYKYAEVFQLR
jgi:LmbE family N-acetylglucosaminyl deacetylase